MAVRQEKNKKRLPKDGRSWYFDVYYKNIYGEKKEKKSKYYHTKKQAQEAEREFLNNLKVKIDKVSFEKLFNEWLIYKYSQVKKTTFYGIKKSTIKHILKFFIKYNNIHDITTLALSEWKNQLEKSIKTQNTMIGYLQEILQYACDYYSFNKKIALSIQKHRVDVSDKINDAEYNFWTYEEFEQFIKNVDDELYKKIFKFLYYTGLRKGELIGLSWKHVNLTKGYISIEDNFSYNVEGEKFTIVSPKTKNSIRNVDLDNELLSMIREHYKQEHNIYGFNDNMFVFGNVSHISATTLDRRLKEYIEKANIKKINIHGFRHSHVSLLIHLGCDARDVADRIGDTVQTVEKTYYHMFPNKRDKTLSSLNNFKNTR